MITRGRISRMTLATFSRFSHVFSTRPSGMSSARRQPTPRILAASAASRARSSADPRVPISPCVRSRMPVCWPRCAALSSVPPQVCSTSPRCAAMARMSREVELMSLQIPLFQDNILPHDQPVRCHFLQSGQNAAYMFVGIHEKDDNRQLASGLDHVRGFHPLASEKTGDGMKSDGRIDVFLAQVAQNFHMQGRGAPLVGFIQVDGDLHGHAFANSTAVAPAPYPPEQRRGKECCC